MKSDVILGLQWGDEGKGKIVDYLAEKYDVVARFQGGPNAGHTLEFDHIKHVLHQVPSGIFRSSTKNIVGNGVVLDPVIFKKEIEALKEFKIEPFYNLFISKRAQLILPTHRLLDAAYEKSKGDEKIGSTLRGIGPTYQDKTARVGLRVGDIISDNFKKKYEKLKTKHISILDLHDFEYDLIKLEAEFFEALDYLKKFKLVDTDYLINQSLAAHETILAEGAQGSLLDIDFGSYPFVTSSNTTCAGVCSGLGIAPSKIGQVYGIFKAYCTRVGEGPFPTELNNEVGEKLRRDGHEFGATTGRPRRCGWIDLPALKYAIMINGVTQLSMMKVDVLDKFEEIQVCTHYRLKNGTLSDLLPFDLCTEHINPVYKTLKGWNTDITEITEYNALPEALIEYVKFLEGELKVPINIVSVGPNRKQTIFKNNHFHKSV
ncbi:MAG: adenylosuccinate synthase [Cytophagales bacterium]|nr:adenylosuccinate synthase [Cytophagales bacterium]